jgi:hypothetical protein
LHINLILLTKNTFTFLFHHIAAAAAHGEQRGWRSKKIPFGIMSSEDVYEVPVVLVCALLSLSFLIHVRAREKRVRSFFLSLSFPFK